MKILYAITTYDGYAYVDLSITMHKKFGNDVIVIDDGSLSDKLNEICIKQNVPLFNFCVNSCNDFGNGDVVSTTQAIQYAYFHGYDYLVKQSRRFIFKENPTPDLENLIKISDSNTYSAQWRPFGWGFTTCCVAYKTSIWINAIKELFNKVKTKDYFGMPQPLIHDLAKKYVSQSDTYKNYMIQHPQAEDAQGYVIWKFIEPSKQSEKIIWHFVNDENDYYEFSKQIGLSYTFDDYKIIDSHQQRHHKKRPHL